MNNKQKIKYIIDWIKTYASSITKSPKSLIVGVSGGIDSALTSMLCAMSGLELILIKIPIKSKDISLSREHCDYLTNNFANVKSYEIDLTSTFEKFQSSCADIGFINDLGLANSKARIRMTLLYQAAATFSGLVVGTGNKVEDFGVGFYTKYGDGGVDISPIADLTKTEVRDLAKELNISKSIIQAAPTDGLWDDARTDEDQLGLSYEQLEDAMDNKNSLYKEKYLEIRKKNNHKMKPIPICIINKK
jgi:NAD+ synthase